MHDKKVQKTHRKEIPRFFSIESRYDRRLSNHLNNRIHEEHVQEYQQGVLLVYPTLYCPLLSVFRVVSTYNATIHLKFNKGQ